MSKATQPTPTPDVRPSAPLLTELDTLLKEPASPDRGRKAWAVILRGVGNPDFHAVLDFAQENDFATACDRTDPRTEPNPTWVNPADGSEMVWIAPGRFVVGPEDRPAECGGFSLARYPVTNAQYHRFTEATQYRPIEDPPADEVDEDAYPNGEFLAHWSGEKPPRGKENYPVVYVSYLDALAYCRWAGLTLPGEFLWEKAARGPDGRPFPWGLERPRGQRLAQIAAPGTCEVTQHSDVRSPYGCSGLVGNVSEWCQPGSEKAPGEFPPHDPTVKRPRGGKPAYAAVRGSAFMRTDVSLMPSSHRRKLSVTRRNSWAGFRPALFLPCRPAT